MISQEVIPHWSVYDQRDLLRSPHLYQTTMRPGLTPEVVSALLQESPDSFIEADPLPDDYQAKKAELDKNQGRVGSGELPCPICGRGAATSDKPQSYIMYVPRVGSVTGVKVLFPRTCVCAFYRDYYTRLCNPDLVEREYRGCTYGALVSGHLKDRMSTIDTIGYATILEAVRVFPNYNYLLAGPAGTGKTTVMTALFERALKQWVMDKHAKKYDITAIWKVRAPALANQYLEYQFRDERKDNEPAIPTPHVLPEMIVAAVRAGAIPHLSIDEFDKYKARSEFQNNKFLDLMQVTQPNGGQIVCASNTVYHPLKSKIGEPHALAMLRRIVGIPRGVYIEFGLPSKVYVNNVRYILKDSKLVARTQDILDTSLAIPSRADITELLQSVYGEVGEDFADDRPAIPRQDTPSSPEHVTQNTPPTPHTGVKKVVRLGGTRFKDTRNLS